MNDNTHISHICFTVCDPQCLYHTVKYDNERWFGMENVAMSLDDNDLKWYTIRKLKQLMLIEIEGKWGGFEWVPLD